MRNKEIEMNKVSPSIRLLACLSLVLIVAAACYPPATPVPPAAPAPSNTITNTVWQWANVTNQTTRETTEVPSPQDYTITFRDDGTLSGQADCNNFTGTYSQDAGFSITLGAMTMAACGDASLDQQYLQLLGAVAAGGPDGAGHLALETAGGEQRMLFNNGGAAAK
jgi:heat shock protein HslJ